MTRFFIHLLLLAVCAAAPAQTLKELEKAHKDKMKELKKSLKLKRVEIRQDPDGTYYMLLMSKSKLVGRADMEGKVILPAVYYSIVKDRLSDGKDVFIVNNGHDRNGIADMSGKFIVPTQYSSFLFCDAIDKGVDYVYDNQMERTGDSVAVYHDAEPAVIYAKGTPSRIYDLDGTVLRDSIMTDKRVYVPGYFFIGAERVEIDDVFAENYISADDDGKKGLLSQSGKEIIPYGALTVRMFAPYFNVESFVKKYGEECNWCVYYTYDAGLLKEGGVMIGHDEYSVPPVFNSVRFDKFENNWEVKKTEMSEYVVYTPEMNSESRFRDKGEEYYEKREYDKVIDFYAHEGVEKPWAKFFTALSLYNKANDNIDNMNTISYIIEKKPDYSFLIKEYSFDIELATKQFNTTTSLLDSYIQGEDSTYLESAEDYLRYTASNLDSIPKYVARYEAAMKVYQQRQAAQAAELKRQQEQKRQQNAAFWGGILSAFVQGAVNAVTGTKSTTKTTRSASTYNIGTGASVSSSSGSSSKDSSRIAEWKTRRNNAVNQLAKYKAQQVKDPDSAYLKSVIQSTEEVIRTCDQRLSELGAN